MRPFVRLGLTALGLFVAGLALAGLAVAAWCRPEETLGAQVEALGWLVACASALGACFCLLPAGLLAVRTVALADYAGRPDLLGRVGADLSSPRPGARRLALQALADFAGHPFGLVRCWPWQRHSKEQFEGLVRLYLDWLRLRQAASVTENVPLEECRARALALHLLACGLGEWPSSGFPEPDPEVPLLPLDEAAYLAALTPLLPDACLGLLRAVNHAPSPSLIAAGEGAVRSVLLGLLWDALELAVALRLRLGKPALAPEPTAIRRAREARERGLGARVSETLDRLADTVRDTLTDWRADRGPHGEPGPLPHVRPEQLEEAMRGPVCEALLAVAEAVNHSASPGGCTAQLRPLFDDLLHVALARAERLRVDEAVGHLPPAERDGWVDRFRRMRAGEGRAQEL
jgi:hypothetical protein